MPLGFASALLDGPAKSADTAVVREAGDRIGRGLHWKGGAKNEDQTEPDGKNREELWPPHAQATSSRNGKKLETHWREDITQTIKGL